MSVAMSVSDWQVNSRVVDSVSCHFLACFLLYNCSLCASCPFCFYLIFFPLCSSSPLPSSSSLWLFMHSTALFLGSFNFSCCQSTSLLSAVCHYTYMKKTKIWKIPLSFLRWWFHFIWTNRNIWVSVFSDSSVHDKTADDREAVMVTFYLWWLFHTFK